MEMRVIQRTTSRTYLKNLNNSQRAMNLAMNKVETGKSFSSVSQSVAAAAKAIDIRTRIYKNETTQNNVSMAIEYFDLAEGAVTEISDIASNIYSEMLRAMNGENYKDEKEIFKTFLEESKSEVLRLANQMNNNKYLLGGLETGEEPFKADENGNVSFNNTNMSEVVNKKQAINQAIENLNKKIIFRVEEHIGEPLDCEYYNYFRRIACVDHEVPFKCVGYEDVKKYCCASDIESYENYMEDRGYTLPQIQEAHYWIPGDECYNDKDNRAHTKDDKIFLVHMPDNEVYGMTFGANGGFLGPSNEILNISLTDESIYKINTVPVKLLSEDRFITPEEYEQAKKQTEQQIEQLNKNENNYFINGESINHTGDSGIDIGLDMSSKSGSYFSTVIDGLSIMGFGKTKVSDIKSNDGSYEDEDDCVSNNIYDMMTLMQDALENEDLERMDLLMNNFKKQMDNIITARSEIGIKNHYLETTLSRLESENEILYQMQNNFEKPDEATEITNFMTYKNAWNLTMQFGSNIVPKSLMDYVM